jgi:hypothetical protein
MTRVIGPPRSRRRGWWYGGATLVAALFFVVFFVASSGAVVSGSPSGFESNDGNMLLNATTANTNTDWNCFLGHGGFQPGTPSTNCKVTTGATQVTADANGEISWVNGQKFDTQCPALAVNNNPPKDEFTNVAAFSDTAANQDVFFYGATIRSTANGNASGDVEFNQGSGNGTTSAGCRTAGDRLIAYDFLNGGTSLDFHVLTWIDSGHPSGGGNSGTCLVKNDVMPCWGANVIHPTDSSTFEGEANQAAITAANNGMSGTALVAQQFAEFGINLTQALGLTGCINFPQQVWESRSSGSSFTSNPQDIEITNETINNCASITIIKHTSPRGINQVFSYTSNLPVNATAGGVNASPCTAAGIDSSGNFCLNDSGNTTADNGANTVTAGLLSPGSYTVTEGADPTGFGFGSVSCTNRGSAATNTTISGKAVTIALASGDVVVCTYVNNQQLGAIKITKASSKVSTTLLSAAHFEVCTNAGPYNTGTNHDQNPCVPAQTGSGDVQTGTNGTVCLENLGFATYYVTETQAPSGYGIDNTTANPSSQTATVSANASCSSTSGQVALTFTDTPLTTIVVTATGEAASGTTKSKISCTNSSSTTVGTSVTTFVDPASETIQHLPPDTYTCVVVVDP